MARIYKRKGCPNYYLDFRYQGKRYRISTGFTDKRSALVLLRDVELSLAMDKFPDRLPWNHQGLMRFRDIAREVLPVLKRTRKRFLEKEGAMFRRLVEGLGDATGSELNTTRVEAYVTRRIKEGATNSLLNHELRLLKRIFHLAVDMGYMDKVPRFSIPKEPPGRIRYLEPGELKRLLEACRCSRSPHIYTAVMIALYTGMRKGEILSLRWKDIDFSGGFIKIGQSKTGHSRIVPLVEPLAKHLSTLKRTGERVVPVSDIKAAFATACRRAGIQDFRFHDLRHHFASYLVMSGVDIRTVAELLGHKTLAMTMRYAHLRPEHLAKALAKYGHTMDTVLNSVHDD